MSSDFVSLFLHGKGDKTIEFYVNGTMSADYTLPLPATAPQNGEALVWNSTASAYEWVAVGTSNAAGTVTEVGISAPASLFSNGSPVTTTGDLTFSLISQTAKNFFAAPNGANGVPTFRAIVASDLPNIPSTQITGTLQPAQMPIGTNSDKWQLDADNNGGLWKWDTATSEIHARNNTDTAYASIRVENLYVEGTTTTIDSETLTVADNVVVLNSNVTGTPTENGGIEIERGTENNALNQWNESTDRWEAGVSGSLLLLTRENTGTFTNANLTADTITINHNLNNSKPDVMIENPTGDLINFNYTTIDANSLTVNMSRITPLSGTWKWHARG